MFEPCSHKQFQQTFQGFFFLISVLLKYHVRGQSFSVPAILLMSPNLCNNIVTITLALCYIACCNCTLTLHCRCRTMRLLHSSGTCAIVQALCMLCNDHRTTHNAQSRRQQNRAKVTTLCMAWITISIQSKHKHLSARAQYCAHHEFPQQLKERPSYDML